MSNLENAPHPSPEWEISTACDVQLGPLLRGLSTDDISLQVDIDPDTVKTMLEQLGPETTPLYPIHIELTHGQHMTDPTNLGLHTMEDEVIDNVHSDIKLRMNWDGGSDYNESLLFPPDINISLVHELQHAIDYNDPSQKYVKQQHRRYQFETIKALGTCASVLIGTFIVGGSISIEYLQGGISRLGGCLVSGIIAGGASLKLAVPILDHMQNRAYRKSPLERRARGAEISAWKMPSAVRINYIVNKNESDHTADDVKSQELAVE